MTKDIAKAWKERRADFEKERGIMEETLRRFESGNPAGYKTLKRLHRMFCRSVSRYDNAAMTNRQFVENYADACECANAFWIAQRLYDFGELTAVDLAIY